MIATTPFHSRLAALNETHLWRNWAGYLVAEKFQSSAKHEYFAVRNSAGIFDTSPLYKHRIRGTDAERFLAGVLTRDVRSCPPGRAQYTVWCDDRGYVLEDGVIFRSAADDFMLTSAEPNLAYFAGLVGRLDVSVDDVSDALGALAVQGPRACDLLAGLAPEVEPLAYFGLVDCVMGDVAVTVSRTGYTGDLGYEIWMESERAVDVFDLVLAAGGEHGARLCGQQALLMTRIEAGLVLLGADFESSRQASTDRQRVTPTELGLGWMLRGIDDPARPFIGRRALRAEVTDRTSRWHTVGLVVDWRAHRAVHEEVGLTPPKCEQPVVAESMVYDDNGARVGHTTSSMYSPVLQRHIALARVRPDCAGPGTVLGLELTVDHEHRMVPATVHRLPLFDPHRRTA